MSWNYFFESKKYIRHKVFISYYHNEDEDYRSRFEELFGHLFLNKSVKPGDIDSDLSDEYIKRLIQQGYISDSSVVLVLVGPKTHCRKHVDWEISAGLDPRVGTKRAGLVGLILPNSSLYKTDLIEWLDKKRKEEVDRKKRDVYAVTDEINTILSKKYHKLPPRLLDNILSGYASLYKWTESEDRIKSIIGKAFSEREIKISLVRNGRLQFRYNRCE